MSDASVYLAQSAAYGVAYFVIGYLFARAIKERTHL